jgi:hypothetical protein
VEGAAGGDHRPVADPGRAGCPPPDHDRLHERLAAAGQVRRQEEKLVAADGITLLSR